MQSKNVELERSPSRRSRRGAWILLSVCVIALSLIVMIYAGKLAPVLGFVALAAVLTTIFWLIRTHLPSILLVFVSVLLLSVIATQRVPKLLPDRMESEETDRLSREWRSSGPFDQSLPIVVHIILDELMSPGAMTDDLPGGSRTRQLLLGFGEKHSFRMFDSVYSRYWYTGEVIPHMMNREYVGRTGLDSYSQTPFDSNTRSYPVPANACFDDMANRGYRTAVFQATYMDFCANRNVDLCKTFDSFDPGEGESAGADSPTLRVSMWQTILRAYAPSYTSTLGEKILARIYGLETKEAGVSQMDAGRYDVQRFSVSFDQFTRFVASAPRGSHVFAHFLVPHSPYLLRENCVISGKVDAGYSLRQYASSERDELRRDYFERYLGQVRCVERKLDAFMSAIAQSDNFRDAVILIHGDHGSRISIGEFLEDFKERDFVDNYGTFFAVRAPGVAPGLDCELVSLPEVFRRYAARRVDARPRAGPALPVVVVKRHDANDLVEVPMPVFGCAAGTAVMSP